MVQGQDHMDLFLLGFSISLYDLLTNAIMIILNVFNSILEFILKIQFFLQWRL